MGFRLPCQKGLYWKTVRNTSLSLPVNYLRIGYRLPTRRNSTQQTQKKKKKEWDRRKGETENRKVSRHDKSRRVAPQRLISAALKGHLMLSKDHLQSPTFAFFTLCSTAGVKHLSIKTFITCRHNKEAFSSPCNQSERQYSLQQNELNWRIKNIHPFSIPA